MNLAVVTHTCRSYKRDISRCVKSVEAALPPTAKHYVIETPNDSTMFIKARFKSLELADIVIFVDDDDYISVDSLKLLMSAMSKHDVGLAYTQETVVDIFGKETLRLQVNVKCEDVIRNPCIIHHMSAYRTSCVDSRTIDAAMKYGHGIEWGMKVCAIQNLGAIHIPHNGYYWCQHTNQLHRQKTQARLVSSSITNYRDEMKKWGNRTGVIPSVGSA